MSAPAQRSFAGGELAPALYARTDQVKYATGLRACRNMFIRRHGGASNRPGTAFLAESKNSAVACRLLPFVRKRTVITDTYLMEFGANYIRFYQAGAAVLTSAVSAWVNATDYVVGDLVTDAGVTYYCTVAHTSAAGTDRPGVDASWQSVWYAQTGAIYEIPTPYATADLSTLQVSQVGDVVTIVHPNYAPRELTRVSHTRWTLVEIVFGPAIAAPTNVVATGGAGGTVRYWAVTAVKELTLEESLAGLYNHVDRVPAAGTPVALTWDPSPGAISYNVYRSDDGLTYGLITSAGGNTIPTSDTTFGTPTATADGIDPAAFTPAAAPVLNALAAISATVRAYNGNYTLDLAIELKGLAGSVGTAQARLKIYYARDGEAPVLALTDTPTFVVDEGTVTFPSVPYQILVPDNGYTTLEFTVMPEVQCAAGVGSEATFEVTGTSVAWSGGVFGFSDVGDTPDLSIGPPAQPTLFVPGAFPAAATNFQQRRVFGDTAPDPATVWASRIASRNSFTKSTPLQDDDLVSFSLIGDEAQSVKHLMDLGRLMVFSDAGVFICGDADTGALTPTTATPRAIASEGSSDLRPIKVSDSALFVEAGGTSVRDLQPWQAGGALGGYTGKDLTVYAAHLFDDYTLVDWAFAKRKNSVVWAVRSDGTLLGLTYLREHEIWGWHRHDTDGLFENVCVIPEGAEDAVYVVVNRTINGATKRYVERFATRFFTEQRDACFVDCGSSYDGRNASAITLTLSGGTTWESTELLTIQAAAGTPFVAGNVGDAVVFTAADGTRVQVNLEHFINAAQMTGHATRTIPAELRAVATTTWTLAVSKLGGLSHLEGKSVSVLGDGFVAASPNNAAYTACVVTAGVATFDRPYGVLHVGLPYISDLETLDYDSPGPRTNKEKRSLIVRVGVYVEASRGIWAGRSATVTDDDPLEGLQERKGRRVESYDNPPAPITEYFEITIDSSWENNGGILIRQVDPLPMTVLAAVPIGFLAGG